MITIDTQSKPRYKLNKHLISDNKIKLFETFSGVGTQALALNNLIRDILHEYNVLYEHVGSSDWNIPSIKSYGAIHANHDSPEAKEVREVVNNSTKEELIDALLPLGLSFNDKTVATRANYQRKSIKELRDIAYYNILSSNRGNIMGVRGDEVKGVDMLTFSFPCQDLSTAGKQAGFKDNTTRSGLVWEIIRILEEQDISDRPKVLLMENVKALTYKNFAKGWQELQDIIQDLGYNNYVQILTATDYGVAQSRERVFMVSIREDLDTIKGYKFPEPFPLTKILEDYLEDSVDEKYYISEQMLEGMRVTKFNQYSLEKKLKERQGIADTILARFEGAPQLVEDKPLGATGAAIRTRDRDGTKAPHIEIRPDESSNCLTTVSKDAMVVEIPLKKEYTERSIQDIERNLVDVEGIANIITAPLQGPTINSTTLPVTKDLRIRKLTPLETWRLMGISDNDFYKAQEVNSNSQLYKQAGNAIVVDVLYHIFKALYLEEIK